MDEEKKKLSHHENCLLPNIIFTHILCLVTSVFTNVTSSFYLYISTQSFRRQLHIRHHKTLLPVRV